MTAPQLFELRGKRTFVAGHRGMAGSAIVRRLAREDCEILTVPRDVVDLTRQETTEAWLNANKPDVVFLAAGLVGGIHANNSLPADFVTDNLAIALNQRHDRLFADRASPAMLPLAGVFVALFAADICFVGFNHFVLAA